MGAHVEALEAREALGDHEVGALHQHVAPFRLHPTHLHFGAHTVTHAHATTKV